MVSSDYGSPPHDPAFLPALLPPAALDAASCLALSASAASLGRVILWNASFTLVPPSMASSGSFLNLHHHNLVYLVDLAYQWPYGNQWMVCRQRHPQQPQHPAHLTGVCIAYFTGQYVARSAMVWTCKYLPATCCWQLVQLVLLFTDYQ